MFFGLLGGGNDAKNFFSFSFGFGSSSAQCSQRGGNQGGLKGFWELIQSPGMVWVGRTQRPSNSNPFCLQNTALTQNSRFFPLFLPWNCCFSTKESHPDFPARLCSVPGRRNCWKFRNKNSLLRLWATNLGWNVALVVPIQFFFVFFSLPEKDLHKILRVFVCVSIVCAVISTPKKKKKLRVSFCGSFQLVHPRDSSLGIGWGFPKGRNAKNISFWLKPWNFLK